MKKILFICKGHQNIAGAQLYLKHLSEAFGQHEYQLHYAFHFQDGDRVFNDIAKNKQVFTWQYDWRHLSFKKSFQEAVGLLRKLNPCMVFYNSSEDEIIPAILAGSLCRIPCLTMVVHWAQAADSMPMFVKKKTIPFLIPSKYALITRMKRSLSYALLDKIIFVNHVTHKAYISLYWVSKSKCVTIYNGVDLKKYSFSKDFRQKTRHLLSVDDNHIMLLATGNLTTIKGHRILIDAVEILLSKGKKVRCFIAGQGELEASLRQYINKKDLTREISLLGYRDDIPELLAATDIFCMPSLNEALGYSLIEAMAAGKPVVASKVGGIPEVITDTQNGLLVPPGKPYDLSAAMLRLIEDKYLMKNICRNAKRNIEENFSLNKMILATTQFLGSN